tara:strand:- start:28 stop:1749 length:1722 start_codon:yes stop_codon:yes gene_type:complete
LAQPGLGFAAMWIYLLIGLLFLILAVEGYFKGGVNGVITLLGVIIAINFSGAFGGFAYGWLADKWPIGDFPFWHRVVPTVAGFITIALLFAIAGLVVSIIIRKRLADRWDEFQIDSYKGMNRKFGFCTGLITATVYSVMMLAIIYRLGNFTVPFQQEDGDEGMLAMLNESRVQLDDTPFLKIAAAYDTTPDLHYEIRDALLLIWDDRGREMQDLMKAYPGFYALRYDPEIRSLIGDSEDDSSEDSSDNSYVESYEDDSGSTGGSEGDGDSLYHMWKSNDSLTLDQILSNSDVVAAVNNRYEELKTIEPGSDEAKRLGAFIKDLTDEEEGFLRTGKSKLYGRDLIVGRWKFALNASLRETKKNYVDINSAEEMRGIWSRLDGLKGSQIKIWPSEDGKKLRIYGFSMEEVIELANEEILKLYKEGVESGDIEEDDTEDIYSSMPADYGADGQQTNQNKANELDKAQKWFIENKPYAYSNIYAQKRAKAENNRLLAKGEWDGTGFLYRLNIQKERVRAASVRTGNLLTTINLAGTNLDYSIKGSNLESSLNGDMQDSDKLKLHISLGKDTLVFTRF